MPEPVAEREARLASLHQLVRRFARRSPTPPDSAPEETRAYLELIAACGYAHLGDHRRADALVDTAGAALAGAARDEPAHGYLLAAFKARILGTPLPALEPLGRVDRYRVDRVREVSRFLEPSEQVEAIGIFSRRMAPGADQRAELPERFARVRALFATDLAAASTAVEALLAEEPATPSLTDLMTHVDAIARVIAGAPYDRALPWLDRLAEASLPRATDGPRPYGTAPFYCLAALAVADALVGAAIARA